MSILAGSKIEKYNELGFLKAGFFLKAVFPPRNLGSIPICRSRFKQFLNCSLIKIPRIYVLRCFVNFWVIFGYMKGDGFSQRISEI